MKIKEQRSSAAAELGLGLGLGVGVDCGPAAVLSGRFPRSLSRCCRPGILASFTLFGRG